MGDKAKEPEKDTPATEETTEAEETTKTAATEGEVTDEAGEAEVSVGDVTLTEANSYPLQYVWTMWFNPPNRPDPKSSTPWQSNVKKIISFGTVVDFWRLFNNLMSPSKLQIGSNYHMFKEGILPEWEEDANKNGGKWVINFTKRSEHELKDLDDAWMWTVLALIGEYFEDSEEICGVVISPRRKENRLALWTRDARNEAAVKRIGQTFKKNVNAQTTIGYQVHADCLKHGTSFRNENLYNL